MTRTVRRRAVLLRVTARWMPLPPHQHAFIESLVPAPLSRTICPRRSVHLEAYPEREDTLDSA